MAELFDTRLYRTLGISKGGTSSDVEAFGIRPHTATSSFVGDYYETPGAALQGLEFADENADNYQEVKAYKEARAKHINDFLDREWDNYLAPFSAVHPYALIKLAGASGYSKGDATGTPPTIDKAGRRRWYEIDGTEDGGYAKNPTTSAIINWGNQDSRGRTPYSFQDFVFCKYWNRIQNNRMITLRRYPMPVPDSIEPGSYSTNSSTEKENTIFAPVCTAVTYFGEGTENTLSNLLSFSVGYEWSELKGDVWKVTSEQNNEGNILGSGANTFLSEGLKVISLALGFFGDAQAQANNANGSMIDPLKATNAPPDPYVDGPYENRIVGPINVINKVMKRERGLKFSQDNLEITFDYIARPIAGINNKAIMLDLLANILLMTTSTGTFFGGLHRYRTERPAVYPWKDYDALNALYKGKIFGKEGAPAKLIKNSFNTFGGFIADFAKDILKDIKEKAGSILNAIIPGAGNTATESANKQQSNGTGGTSTLSNTVGRMVSAHLLKNSTVPYLQGLRALLSGEPTGDWHLTIGNPLNPIAMIGNLIVDDCTITLSDELGPDDFPIGFTAKIKLKHALGRDKDAVESMFNRGYGRIYSLPTGFKTQADGESAVDAYTGTHKNANSINNTYSLGGSGNMYIMGMSNKPLFNSGTNYNNKLRGMELDLSKLTNVTTRTNPGYITSPWQAHWNM